MAVDGSCPLALKCTKPYGYSLINRNTRTLIGQIRPEPTDDFWACQTAAGRGIRRGIEDLPPSWPTKAAGPCPRT